MKINITIKAKSTLEPLTTTQSQVRGEIAKILRLARIKIANCYYVRKARLDKNGKTIGQDFTLYV